VAEGENGGGGPEGAAKREELEQRAELERAHEILFKEARTHGPLGYYIYREVEGGQVSSIILAATDPEVIGKLWPALMEIEGMP
jgi:hypothetical protein